MFDARLAAIDYLNKHQAQIKKEDIYFELIDLPSIYPLNSARVMYCISKKYANKIGRFSYTPLYNNLNHIVTKAASLMNYNGMSQSEIIKYLNEE